MSAVNQLAAATINRRLKMARMFFVYAKKLKLISENPFAEVNHKYRNPEERRHYVSREDIVMVLEHTNRDWRIIIALARFAGLRCPSEVFSLKWEFVDFAQKRMLVHSPKTEHLANKSSRIMPIFSCLRPYLQDAFNSAKPGDI